MSINMKKESIMRAISHITLYRDTDLFPHLKELDILFEDKDVLLEELVKIDIGNYDWQPYRRFIIPKDEVSYRVSIQLDPIDSILFESIVYEYGNLIEARRIPIIENKIFSNRFAPNDQGQLYDKKDAWKNYWESVSQKTSIYPYAVYIDIADFYNRIYHHTLENQMAECGLPNQIIKSVKKLMQNTTQTVSQGIPVGTHASHIFAEMYLIPLDEGMKLKGYNFCRYVDDIFIFAENAKHAKLIIYEMAKMLDSLKLTMQRQKTKIFAATELKMRCERMQDDDPINDLEKNIINVISKYSKDDPYQSIDFMDLDEIEQMMFSEENIQTIISYYLSEDNEYQRIRWLYKSLSKLGVDTALSFTIDNIENLIPAISDIALYFASVADITEEMLSETGEKLICLLENEIIKSNEFFQLTILNLFTCTNKFNNVSVLLGLFSGANEYIKREIVLAALMANAVPWVRDIKHEYNNLGIWSKRALIIASSLLPKDERKFFLQTLSDEGNLSLALIKKHIKNM